MPPQASTPVSPRKTSTASRELSNYEYAVGLVLLILYGALCLGVGIVIGRWDNTPKVPPPVVAREETTPEATGMQQTVQERPLAEEPATAQRPVRIPPRRTEDRAETDATKPDESGTDYRAPTRPVVELPKIDSPTPPVVTETPLPPTEEVTGPDETTPATPVKPDESTEKPAATVEVTAPTVSSSENGVHYSVQVAAFGEKKNAEEAMKKLAAETDYEVSLAPSANGKLTLLFVGNYPDRESAEKVCGELRARPGFSGCFVKEHH